MLHVNGDDPEAVVLCAQLAIHYRQEFKKDIVLDIVCFRRLRHNEQDTPAVTQPLMYKKIAQHPGTRKLYADKLVTQKAVLPETPDEMVKAYRAAMDAGRHTVDPVLTNYKSQYAVDWSAFLNRRWTDHADTGVPLAELKRLAQRITGQDSGRGTFTHRHAVLHEQNREKWDAGAYVPLQHVSEKQAPFLVIDSVLSEEAVLGFEYGYSSAEPNALVIWEAQFGDFVNGAQVVIDQFIASGEVKWGRQSGLTLMLPHGYEGQGPEHSSARIERFLQLAADNNMQVAQPTSAAQIFHLLRRQMIRLFRKPLVIMTPKSLLRAKDASSLLVELARGEFHTVIPDQGELDPKDVKRIILCSGKVYFDLAAARRERGDENVVILRVEQLYPFPHKAIATEFKNYSSATDIVWCQDEPQNQGAWFYVQHHLLENMVEGQKLGYAGRAASASPAVGYYAKHIEQQKQLIPN